MFHPARLNSAIVESCRLPLGSPSRNLSATSHLRRLRKRYELGEATHSSFVADESVAFHHYAEQQGIVVAIRCSSHHAQPVSAALALRPQLLPCPAPEGDVSTFKRFSVADGIKKAQHQHLAGAGILHDSGHQAIHLLEINLWLNAHKLPVFE